MAYTDPVDYLNSKDSSFTKVHKAAKLGDALKLKTLLAQSTSLIDEQDTLGNTPLHYAVMLEHYEASKCLLELEANITLINQAGMVAPGTSENKEISALFTENETTLISQLTLDSAGEMFEEIELPAPLTQLFAAVNTNDIEQLRELITSYPPLLNKQKDNGDFSLLHAAVINNHYKIAQTLIESGIEVNIPNKDGETPLTLCNNKKMEKLLKANGACTFSCMHKAVLDNDTEKMMGLAFINHSFVDAIDIEGNTPLHYAAHTSNKNAIETLSALGAAFNKVNRLNQAPINHTFIEEIENELKIFGAINHDPFLSEFHILSIDGDLSNLQKAIANKEEMESLGGIDHGDGNGDTALMHAVMHNRPDIVDTLLASEANPMLSNNNGLCAIDWANACERTDILNKLKSACYFSPEQKLYFENSINNLIHKFQSKKDKRKILFVVGETHDNYKIDQFQEILLDCLSKHELSTLFFEHDAENIMLCKIPKTAQEIGFNVIPVDMHPSRASATIQERNKIIADIVNKSNKCGALIVGSSHLKGLLSHDDEMIDANKYHIIPMNLSHFSPTYSVDSDYSKFSSDVQKVMQVTEDGIEFKVKAEPMASVNNKIKAKTKNEPKQPNAQGISKILNNFLPNSSTIGLLLSTLLSCYSFGIGVICPIGGYFLGSALSSLRSKYLDYAASQYHTVENSIVAQNACEKEAIKVGIEAKNWAGYLTSYTSYAANRHPLSFAAGMKLAVDEDEKALPKLKVL